MGHWFALRMTSVAPGKLGHGGNAPLGECLRPKMLRYVRGELVNHLLKKIRVHFMPYKWHYFSGDITA